MNVLIIHIHFTIIMKLLYMHHYIKTILIHFCRNLIFLQWRCHLTPAIITTHTHLY